MATNTIKRAARASVIAATIAATAAIPAVQATAAPITIEGIGTFEVPDNLVIPTNFQIPAPPAIALPTIPDFGSIQQISAPFSKGQAVVDAAMSKIGSPYVWGAAGPNGFDCSGLVYWAHQQVGLNIPRVSYDQAAGGIPVAYNQLQPGDVVLMYGGASHAAIYIGNGQVVHALNSSVPVKVDSLGNFPFHSARRYV